MSVEDDLPPLYEEDEVLEIPPLVDITQLPKNLKFSDFWERLDQSPKDEDDLPPLLDGDENMSDLPTLINEDDPNTKKLEKKQPKQTIQEEFEDLPPLLEEEEEEEEKNPNEQSTPKEGDLPPLVEDEDEEETKEKTKLKQEEEEEEIPPLLKEEEDEDEPPALLSSDDEEEEEKIPVKKEKPIKKVNNEDEPPPLASDEDDEEDMPDLLNSSDEDKKKPRVKKIIPKVKPNVQKEIKKPKPEKKTEKKSEEKKKSQPKKKKDQTKKMAKLETEQPVKKEKPIEKVLSVIAHCKIKLLCTKTSDEIKEEEEYFRVKCNEKCLLEFHKPCWLKYQRENKERNFLKCPTPDCEGYVEKAERFYKDLDTEKMNSSIQEFSIPIEEKKKEKKKPEKKEKKLEKEMKNETKKVEKHEIKKEIKQEPQKIEIKKEEPKKVEIVNKNENITSPRNEKVEIKVVPTGTIGNLDTDKILQDLKKKKELESEKWTTQKPKTENKKQKSTKVPLNSKGLEEIFKISKENQKYSGGIHADYVPQKKEEKEEKKEKEETFWEEEEEDDRDIFFIGEIIYLNVKVPAYGLLRDNINQEVLNFPLDNEGNQSGKDLQVGDKVKFIRQENSTNCIVMEKV